MFHGTFEQRIDEKGRVSVPVKFRDELRVESDRLFVTNFKIQNSRCLDVFTPAEWQSLSTRLRERQNLLSAEAIRFFQNYYFPGAHDCQLDKQGRLLVPPVLREYAGLVKDVVFTGAGSKFQIWDREARRPVFDSAEEFTGNSQIITDLGL